jgi:hypothetical protein
MWVVTSMAGALGGIMVWTAIAALDDVEDPIYAGTTLSSHLYALYTPMPIIRTTPGKPLTAKMTAKLLADSKKRATAREALWFVKPGREALPLLTNWLASAPVPWKAKVGEWLWQYDADYLQWSVDRRMMALQFLSQYSLGAANDLLSIVARELKNTNRFDAISLISAVSRNLEGSQNVDADQALRVLMPLKYDPSWRLWRPKANRFSHLYANVDSYTLNDAIDRVDPERKYTPLYMLELAPLPERVGAAMELAASPRLPERAVPLLAANLSVTNRSVQENCAVALGKYGVQARSALPALTNLLVHPRERVRMAASNAVVAINGTNTVVIAEGGR